MMRIGIFLSSIYKGILVNMGAELAKTHEVFFVALGPSVKMFMEKNHPEFAGNIVDISALGTWDESVDVVRECLKREEKFGVKFSFLLAQDRGLGKGYLSNVQWHPDRADAFWPKDRKLAAILKDVKAVEDVCDLQRPDVMLGFFNLPRYGVVLRQRKIPYLTLAPVKFHDRYLWCDNEYITSTEFADKVRAYAAGPLDEDFELPEYAQVEAASYLFKQLKTGYASKVRQALGLAVNEFKRVIRGTRPEHAYQFMGWVWPVLRYPHMYNYMMRKGVVPGDLKGSRVVFFPMHFEPELALMSFSPEVNNSYEVISWLSKSVPADTYIVIKEQPHMFGMRSKWYYEMYRKMANVLFARPDVSSWEWIKGCDVVSTITGTAATESVFFGKPLMSFCKHNIVNDLPSVRVASNYEETKSGIEHLINDVSAEDLKKSKYALCRAQMDVSFELPDVTKYLRKDDAPGELALSAVQGLCDHYPELFAGAS